MTKFLLDTSIILEILAGTARGLKARKFLEVEVNCEIVTSVICFCEVLNKTNLTKLTNAENFLSSIAIFPLSLSDGEVAKDFQYTCRKSGNYVSTIDCLIAATATNNGATILATDSDFERIEGVKKIIF